MSFRDDTQCRIACDLLLARFELPGWFCMDDIDAVIAELDAKRSNSRTAMLGFCMAMFNHNNRCRISDLVYLDMGNLRAVATLLLARSEGPEAVDAWMISDAIAPCPDPALPTGFEWVDEAHTKARPRRR